MAPVLIFIAAFSVVYLAVVFISFLVSRHVRFAPAMILAGICGAFASGYLLAFYPGAFSAAMMAAGAAGLVILIGVAAARACEIREAAEDARANEAMREAHEKGLHGYGRSQAGARTLDADWEEWHVSPKKAGKADNQPD